MILQPILPGITDHGQLDGLTDDDHSQYLLIDSARGIAAGQKIYVGPNAYFIESGGRTRFFVNGVEEGTWSA